MTYSKRSLRKKKERRAETKKDVLSRLGKVVRGCAELRKEIRMLSGENADLRRRISSQTSDISRLSAAENLAVNQARNLREQFAVAVTGHNQRVDAAVQEATRLSEELTNLRAEKVGNETRFQGEVATLREAIQTLSGEVARLKQELRTARAESRRLRGELLTDQKLFQAEVALPLQQKILRLEATSLLLARALLASNNGGPRPNLSQAIQKIEAANLGEKVADSPLVLSAAIDFFARATREEAITATAPRKPEVAHSVVLGVN